MNKLTLFLVFNLLWSLIAPLNANAGVRLLSGIVSDNDHGSPLPFVMVCISDSHTGVLTDVDGRFTLKSSDGVKTLRFTCKGYASAIIDVPADKGFLKVILHREIAHGRQANPFHTNQLGEPIIKQVILFRDKHNPANLKTCSFTARDFVVMAPAMDSILWIDRLKMDSLTPHVGKLLSERSFYTKEAINMKLLLPGQSMHEKQLSSREVGFKDPMFLFLIAQFQTISFFTDDVTIGNKNFLNPLSASGLAKYRFTLCDTLVAPNGRDTTFNVDFFPKMDSLANGLMGSFFIDADGWAVKALKVEPLDKEAFFDALLYQLFEKREGVWFPAQIRSDLFLINNKSGSVSGDKSFAGCNRRYFSNVHLNEREVLDEQQRVSQQEITNIQEDRSQMPTGNQAALHNTIGAPLPRSVDAGPGDINMQLLSGKLKAGWFSFEINKLLRYNKFEGLNLGLGGHTNNDFSKLVSIGGYATYGFRDTKLKYGSDLSLWLDPYHQSSINAAYSYDTRESGGSRFFDESYGALNTAGYRFFYVKRMDYERKAILSVKKQLGFSTFFFGVQQRIIERGYDITNGTKILLPTDYYCSGIVAGVRLAPGEVMTESNKQLVSLGSRFPIFWFQYTRGVKGLLKGEFNYNRYESKISYDLSIPRLGNSSFLLIGNKVDGAVPYFEYFNGRGTYGSWGLFASGSFVTMHPDEFLNDQFLALFYMHRFGRVFPATSFVKIEPALAFNFGWGELKNRPSGYYLPASDCRLGYLETGLQINNLINLKIYNLGLGAYYRLGAYSNTAAKDNLVFKIVINFAKP